MQPDKGGGGDGGYRLSLCENMLFCLAAGKLLMYRFFRFTEINIRFSYLFLCVRGGVCGGGGRGPGVFCCSDAFWHCALPQETNEKGRQKNPG